MSEKKQRGGGILSSGSLEAHISTMYLKSLQELKKHPCNTILEGNVAFSSKQAGPSVVREGKSRVRVVALSISWVSAVLMSR